jgi:hypothetical protein
VRDIQLTDGDDYPRVFIMRGTKLWEKISISDLCTRFMDVLSLFGKSFEMYQLLKSVNPESPLYFRTKYFKNSFYVWNMKRGKYVQRHTDHFLTNRDIRYVNKNPSRTYERLGWQAVRSIRMPKISSIIDLKYAQNRSYYDLHYLTENYIPKKYFEDHIRNTSFNHLRPYFAIPENPFFQHVLTSSICTCYKCTQEHNFEADMSQIIQYLEEEEDKDSLESPFSDTDEDNEMEDNIELIN